MYGIDILRSNNIYFTKNLPTLVLTDQDLSGDTTDKQLTAIMNIQNILLTIANLVKITSKTGLMDENATKVRNYTA